MDRKTNIFQSNTCPEEAVLKAYLKGKLTKEQIRQVELHLADCEMCSDELEGMSKLSEQELEKNIHAIKSKTHHLLFNREKETIPLFSKLLVAASVLLVWSLMFMFQHSPKTDQRLADIEERQLNAHKKIGSDPVSIQVPSDERSTEESTEKRNDDPTQDIMPIRQSKKSTSRQSFATTDIEPSNAGSSISSGSIIEKAKLAEADDQTSKLDKKSEEESKGNNKTNHTGLIQGSVKDPNGISLPGVTIQIKGTTNAVITDIDGKFSLDPKGAKDPVLVCRFIGYDTKEQQLPSNLNDSLSITLFEEAIALDEVVVVGYGSQKKQASSQGSIARMFRKETKGLSSPTVDLQQSIREELAKAQRFEGLNIDSALFHYKKVISLEPKHIKAQLSIVYCYVKADRLAMAEFKIAELLKQKSSETMKPNLLRVKRMIEEEDYNKALLLLMQMRH